MEPTSAAARWAGIVDDCESSGLTAREYAEANNLSPRTLKWWRWKLGRSPEPEPTKSAFYELCVEEAGGQPVPEPPTAGGVVLSLDRFEASVLVDSDTDLALLRRMLGALC
ncbi:MAG: hypothetical protein ABIO70_12305 [Pseudomonadota bacterium]